MNNLNSNEILNALENGIKKGKKAHKTRKVMNLNVIVLALIIVTFSISVNVSSAFAASMKNIPILGEIVDFVRLGSGFNDAAENGYFIEGDTIIKDDDYEVSIEGYYYSDKNMNIVIKLAGKQIDDFGYDISDVDFLDDSLNKIFVGSTGYGSVNITEDYATANIVVNQREGILPDEMLLRFSIRKQPLTYTESPVQNSSEDIDIEYDYLYEGLQVKLIKQFNEETTEFSIEQDIDVNDMLIKFKKLTLTPTTMNLEVDIESESMQFYNFKSIYFKSGNKIYNKISNGVTSSGSVENGLTYYFETSLFDDAESIELIIDGIYALPKNNSSIFIDIKENKTVYSIDDQLIFERVEDTGKFFTFYFTGGEGQQVQFKSINGERIFSSEGGFHNDYTEYYIKIEKELVTKSLVKIDFYKYPNEIEFHKEIVISE